MKIIIFGIGDFAKQLHYYLSIDPRYKVDYFCVTRDKFSRNFFLNKKILILDEILKTATPKEYKFIMGVGYKDLIARKNIFDEVKKKGFDFINYVNPTSIIHGNIIGEGNIILSNVVIEPFAEIQNNNIIWSNSLICHDSVVGNNNFIAANSVVGGFSRILESNFLGFNTIIKDNVSVNNEVLIGANSLLLKDTEDYSVYYGNPARKISDHNGIKID